jgi:hypothetical protein
MAAANISAVSVPAGGYNLTDSADFTTLVAGAGNGVTFTYNPTDLIIMKNDTGGAGVFTIKTPTPAAYSGIVTVGDETVSVANGKTYMYPILAIFKNTSTGKITIECDVAGKVLVVRPANT